MQEGKKYYINLVKTSKTLDEVADEMFKPFGGFDNYANLIREGKSYEELAEIANQYEKNNA